MIDLFAVIDEAIDKTIDEGVEKDKKFFSKDMKKEISEIGTTYKLYGAWFSLNFKNNLKKILKERGKNND